MDVAGNQLVLVDGGVKRLKQLPGIVVERVVLLYWRADLQDPRRC
jgi:hypothetical protein